jgi:hypothetical protein
VKAGNLALRRVPSVVPRLTFFVAPKERRRAGQPAEIRAVR